jgi:hypothetical protein
MSGEIVKGSITITKRRVPATINKRKYPYEVEYTIYPYGRESRMRERKTQLAISKKDAEEWKKTLLKDVV